MTNSKIKKKVELYSKTQEYLLFMFSKNDTFSREKLGYYKVSYWGSAFQIGNQVSKLVDQNKTDEK